MPDISDINIKFLQGVGPKRAELLGKEIDIHTYRDMLYYFPYRYIDRSKIYTISEITGDMPYIQLKGRILNFTVHGEGAKQHLTSLFTDGTGTIELIWFRYIKSIREHYNTGTEYIIFGKPALFNHKWNIAQPEMDTYNPEEGSKGLRPMYNTTEKMKKSGMTSKVLQKIAETLWLTFKGEITENIPQYIINTLNLMSRHEALKQIHFPQNMDLMRSAEQRLKFEELYMLQLHILRYTRHRNKKVGGQIFSVVGEKFNGFYNNILPFPLTKAQMRVIKEIRADMGSGKQMNRLLQGDVGSGKTLVALMTMLIAIDNGFQTCIMAPTEILATQHYETLRKWVEPIGIKIELLKGSVSKKDRVGIHEGLQNGSVGILVGTHAVIEDDVHFRNLGMVVIDEQHRFGVQQRAKLWQKNIVPPHILVMTATPIPRTLAMTVYGDLDVSVIDELPPGRKPIQTLLQYDNTRAQLMTSIGKQLKQGRQIYIVYPLIKENEKLDLKNLEDGFEYIKEQFPSYKVCMVHGKMKPAEKDYQMQCFLRHEADIMVATTVIEVGVNVPNASVMVIENAERFGLSQLHQLRGRVGRGADQSYCILMASHKASADTKKRLQIMTETTDGFLISEADMQLRGPGDMEGTQQSGIALNLKIANVATDGQILQQARDMANMTLDNDETLSLPIHAATAHELRTLFSKTVDWSRIS